MQGRLIYFFEVGLFHLPCFFFVFFLERQRSGEVFIISSEAKISCGLITSLLVRGKSRESRFLGVDL